MALSDLTDPDAVRRALREFDEIGRDHFLAKYGFAKSRSYFLIADGRAYDSKAIVGAAHGYQHSELGPLTARDFSGGNATVRARLEALGFTVVVTEPRSEPVRPLTLWDDYHRRDVHDIFAPQHRGTEAHELRHRAAVAGTFEDGRGDQRDGFRIVELEAARLATLGDQRGREDE